MRPVLGLLLYACALVLGAGAAQAHPHVWITATSELIYAPDGSITGVRHAWTFDDMFSTYALQGIETKTRGVYSREELGAAGADQCRIAEGIRLLHLRQSRRQEGRNSRSRSTISLNTGMPC